MPKHNSHKHVQGRKQLETTSQDDKERLNAQFQQLLSQLEDNPKMYRMTESKYVRDFVEYVSNNKGIYYRGLFDSSSESSDASSDSSKDSHESDTLHHPINLCDSEDESASLNEPPTKCHC